VKDVDTAIGLSYILTAPDAEQSANLQCFGSECRNTLYEVVTCPDSPTKFANPFTDSPTPRFTKLIRGGQLYILCDNKTYNAQGEEVK